MPRRADTLGGWKEIAAYLGCSVATAARRERDGLPVFRSGGQVRAFPGDLDKWLKGLRADEISSSVGTDGIEKVDVREDISAVLATLLKGDSKERFAVVRLGKDVAEFEHIEVQLKSAEEKYRDLVEAIPEWVWEMNADTEYVYSSPQVADILGYEPEDLRGFKPGEFLVHPDDAPECAAAFEALTLQKTVVQDLLCRYIHREGSVRYVETSANPVFDVSGNVSGIRGVSRDVTERVRLQKEVAETRTYLENVLHGSMDAIITTDTDGRVKVWNRGAEAIYGYSENEAIGKNVDRLTDPPGWSRKFRDLLAIIEAKGGWYAEEPVKRRRKDGTDFYASASYSIVYGADGKPAGVCGITRDITDRLNAERFTQEALSRFESVIENVPNVAVQGFGRGGTVQHWNGAAEIIFGYSAEETIGTEVGRLPFLPAKEHGVFVKELGRIFATGEPNEPNEFSFDGRGGERRWAYSQMFPVLVDGEVDEVFQISVDVTDRRNAETALRNAAEEWRRTFDAVPDMISILDDEFRISRLNRAGAAAIGVGPKEALGLTCYRAFHGLEEPPPNCPHSFTLQDGLERAAEIYDERSDKYFEVSVTPIKGPTGETLGAVHVARDVSERRRVEKSLRESEERYKTAVETLAEGVFLVDPAENVTFVNRAFAENLGYAVEKLTGKRLEELATGEGYKKILAETEERRSGRRSKYVIEMKHRDGRRLDFLISATPIFADDGTYAGAAATASRLPELGAK